jgi:hypothetical protein
MNLALRDLRHQLRRFVATGVGLGLLFAVVLAMGGIYRGLVEDATVLVDLMGADLWIVQRGTRGPFLPLFPASRHRRTAGARRRPGAGDRDRARREPRRRSACGGAKTTSFADLSLIVPWVISSADDRERRLLEGVLPWPVRLLYRLSWRSRYERLVSELEAA